MDIHFLSLGERPKNHLAILLIEGQALPSEWANYRDVSLYASDIPMNNDITIHRSFHHGQLAVDAESVIFVRIKSPVLENQAAIHQIGSQLAYWCKHNHVGYLSLLSPFSAEDTAQLTMAFYLSSYRFVKYKTKNIDSLHKLRKLNVFHEDPQKVRYHYKPLASIIAGVNFCRDLVNEPPNVLTPTAFAQRIYDSLKPTGVVVETLDASQMHDLGMHALLGVSAGSVNAPRMVVMQWQGSKESNEPPIVLAGKGVCFDSGGISLKPPRNMHEMKFDMAGAASVVGTMMALSKRDAKINVVGIVGLVENMPDGKAQRPGDIVTSLSGKTIEILNTDAEGRLVLADLLWYAQDRFAPKYMIDLATLTGAIMVALGSRYAGLFASDASLQNDLVDAAKACGEPLWPMPMDDESFDKSLRSDVADIKNIGTNYGSANIAACFLRHFTNDVPWAHLDIAGTAWAREDQNCSPKGASGYGVRLLSEFLMKHETH